MAVLGQGCDRVLFRRELQVIHHISYWVVRSVRTSKGGAVKVRIDPEICQGQGRCFSIAPQIFDFDELGNGVVLGDGLLTSETIELARLAQANCPEHAVFIEDSP
jgi:ferredoxin